MSKILGMPRIPNRCSGRYVVYFEVVTPLPTQTGMPQMPEIPIEPSIAFDSSVRDVQKGKS